VAVVEDNYKHSEQIMAQPLQQLRGALGLALSKGAFTQENVETFFAEAEPVIAKEFPEITPLFQAEKAKILQLLTKGTAAKWPDLTHPALQLLWAAGLAVEEGRMKTPGEESAHTQHTQGPIRTLLQKHPTIETYRKIFALEIQGFPGTSGLRLGWVNSAGLTPSHHFNPEKRFLGMDILYSLLMGFSTERLSVVNDKAHASADIMHEIAHGIGTAFTPRMQAVRDEMMAIKKPIVDPAEYTKMATLQAEWNLRFHLLDAAENNYANRFSANQADAVNSYDYSINCTQAIYDGSRVPKYSTPPTVDDAFSNLRLAIDSSFFKNNDFFEDSEEGWRKRHIEPQWISCSDPAHAKKKISGMAAIQELMALCQKLETLQPTARDKWLSFEAYKKKVKECTAARNAVIEEIYDRFAAHLMPEIQKQMEEQVKEQMEKKSQESDPSQQEQEKQPGQKSGGKKKGEDKGEEGKDKKDGDAGGEGQGQGSKKQKSKGTGAGGEKDGREEKEKEKSEQGNGAKKKKGEKEGGGQKPEGESGEKSEGEEGESQPGSGGEERKEGEEAGKKVVMVKGVGEMPEIDIPPESPQAEITEEEIENSKTLEELVQEMREADGGEDSQKPGPTQVIRGKKDDNKTPPPDKPIRPADWNDYLKIVAANDQTIRQVKKMRDDIQKRQIVLQQSRTRTHDHTPDDGDADRFDTAKHADFVTKITTGQSVGEQDSKRFLEDAENKKKLAPIHVFIILDISGSMQGAPFETAINAATVAYEGFKSEKKGQQSLVNIHISTLGGNMRPQFIAKPGDHHQDIGKRIAGARNSIGGGTDFLPALKLAIHKAAHQKIPKDQPVGQTYVFVVSDCVFTDPQESMPAVMNISQQSEHVNVDFLMIPAESYAERQAQAGFKKSVENINAMPSIKNKMHVTQIDSIRDLPTSMLGMLKQRMLTKDRLAKPYGAIQKELKQIDGRM